MVPGQRSLFAAGAIEIDRARPWDRIVLSNDACVDVCRVFLGGADAVLDAVIDLVPWRCGRRFMFDREVDDPRLSYRGPRPELVPHPVLDDVRRSLTARYHVGLDAPAFNCYRDGRDSVAFHRDRGLRDADASLIAILTLGAQRPFRLRPRTRPEGGRRLRTIDLSPASGDLFVMGGTCSRTWEHSVPKVARAGPRVSVTWRWSGDRHVV